VSADALRRCLYLALVLLTACTPVSDKPLSPGPESPEDFPFEFYRKASALGDTVFAVDSEASIAVVRVYRDGRLAHLGHDHLVASRDIQGFILWSAEPEARRADLYVPVEKLTVDEESLLLQYGMENGLSDEDIEATRRNMLKETLDSSRHPFVLLRLEAGPEAVGQPEVVAHITVNGVTRTQVLAVEIEAASDSLRVSGEFSLVQSDFGITPFSALSGLLKVRDQMDISFDLQARADRQGVPLDSRL